MEHDCVIRRAVRDEADAIAAMLARLFGELAEGDETPASALRPQVVEVLRSERYVVFLAVARGQPVGVMTLEAGYAVYTGGPFGTIRELYVEPSHRMAGVGARLLAAATDTARSFGWKRLEVTAPAGERWRRSVGFYEQNGFGEAGPKLKRPVDTI